MPHPGRVLHGGPSALHAQPNRQARECSLFSTVADSMVGSLGNDDFEHATVAGLKSIRKHRGRTRKKHSPCASELPATGLYYEMLLP